MAQPPEGSVSDFPLALILVYSQRNETLSLPQQYAELTDFTHPPAKFL